MDITHITPNESYTLDSNYYSHYLRLVRADTNGEDFIELAIVIDYDFTLRIVNRSWKLHDDIDQIKSHSTLEIIDLLEYTIGKYSMMKFLTTNTEVT